MLSGRHYIITRASNWVNGATFRFFVNIVHLLVSDTTVRCEDPLSVKLPLFSLICQSFGDVRDL